MSKNYRLGVVMVSAALVVFISDSRLAFAQRGGGGQGNQGDRDQDKDEDDEEKDKDKDEDDNSRDNRSSRTGNRNAEQVQQLLQRGQGGQGGQNNQRQGDPNQARRDGRQNQYSEELFKQQLRFRPQEGAQGGARVGGWQGDRWQGSRDVENWALVFGGGRQPFGVEWYNEHPKAWKHEHHDHDDVWIAATLPGIYTWLGWGNAPQQPGVRITAPPDLSRFHDFYPLGVYSLMSGPGDMGTRVVQLSIDRHGHIAGNYYDLITDTNSSVSGEVRRDSQRVTWSVNKNKSIRFRASLNRLVQPYGTVVVQLPGGEQDWQFVRLEN